MMDKVIKIMFVCHGNICRSPMAEFLLKKAVKDRGLDKNFYISSSATSTEELGNPVHYGTAKILDRFGIDYFGKRATLLLKSDYEKYDYFIGMDEANRRNMKRLFNGDKDNKVYCLMDFTPSPREVADPWYTGEFESTYNDVAQGIEGLLKFLIK